jgi:hypothetical protein
MSTTVAPIVFTISNTCLNELTGACDKAVPNPTQKGQMNVTLSRECAEALWNALINALKGPAPAGKKKGGKTSTTVRQKSGRPTGSSPRSSSPKSSAPKSGSTSGRSGKGS